MLFLDSLAEKINKLCQASITITLMLMTILLFSQVLARYVFNTGLTWSEELSRYLMVWMVYLGTSTVFFDNSNISVTVLDEYLPEKYKPYLSAFQRGTCVIFAVIVCWWSIKTLPFAAMQTSPNMMIPMNYIYLVFPLSSIIIIIHLVLGLYRTLRGKP